MANFSVYFAQLFRRLHDTQSINEVFDALTRLLDDVGGILCFDDKISEQGIRSLPSLVDTTAVGAFSFGHRDILTTDPTGIAQHMAWGVMSRYPCHDHKHLTTRKNLYCCKGFIADATEQSCCGHRGRVQHFVWQT
jgi:hypothetical protein